MTSLNLVALSGSLRAHSFNTLALRAAQGLLPEDMALEIADHSDLPFYSADVQSRGFPEAVLRLRDRIAAADGLVIASPEYNFSISGVLKNTIDWLSKTSPQPFKGKPVAILSATTGPLGGARSQYDLRKILGSVEAIVLPKPEIFIGMSQGKFADGELADEPTRALLREQMRAFRDWILRVRPTS